MVSDEERTEHQRRRAWVEDMTAKGADGKGQDTHRCAECGAPFRVCFIDGADAIRCYDGHINPPITLKKTAPRHAASETYADKRRREIMMDDKLGREKATAMARHMETKELAKVDAWEIMHTVYPDVPDVDLARAVGICVSFKLNPLMNHLYMVKFNKNTAKKGQPAKWVDTWQPIISADATRLMASRSGPISYGIEGTPRVMPKGEQLSRFGKSYDDRLWVIYKVQDPRSGAIATGFGFWLNADKVRGEDLGNSDFNMASKRAEIQAVKKLRPSELPENIRTMDTEELNAAIDSEEGIVEGQFQEAPPDPALAAGAAVEESAGEDTTIPEAEATEPAAHDDKDETPVTDEQIAKIKELFEGSLVAVGKYANADKNWNIRDVKDLRAWQYDVIVDAFERGK